MRRVLTVTGPIVFGMCMAGLSFVVATSKLEASTADKAKLVLIGSSCITVFLLAFAIAVWAFARMFSGLAAENWTRLRVGGASPQPKISGRILADGALFVAACLAGILAFEVLKRAT